MNIPEKKSYDILIVDDDRNNLSILRWILTKAGYKVRPVLSGELALQAADKLLPDLILLDILMPQGMDGYEVCAQLKKDDRTKDIPVLFLSALDDTTDKVKAFQAGGVDYISKPFQHDEILARISTHLTLHTIKKELKEKNDRLQKAFEEIKTLKGILPICAGCKKIRDDQGYWEQIESYISKHSDADFSHSICPECMARLYPEFDE